MIGICTVVYNQLSFCKRSIESVIENTSTNYCYLVLFNASPYPGVKEYVESLKGKVTSVIISDRNIGVGPGYNLGLNHLAKNHKLDFFCKIDDDTIIETRDWDKKMLDAFEAFPKLGVLSADIDRGKQIGDYTETTNKGTTIQVFANPSVGGACTMYPMKIFDSLGLFNDFGFYGQEDGEFAQRVRAAGYMTAYLKGVNVKHLGRTDESDPLYDEYKLAYWFKRTELDYPGWLKQEYDKIVT